MPRLSSKGTRYYCRFAIKNRTAFDRFNPNTNPIVSCQANQMDRAPRRHSIGPDQGGADRDNFPPQAQIKGTRMNHGSSAPWKSSSHGSNRSEWISSQATLQ